MNEQQPDRDEPKKPTKPKHAWVAVLAILVVGIFLYGVYKLVPISGSGRDFARFKAGPLTGLEIADQAPAQPTETFTGADGKPVQLAAFKGKVVLINLWATWCAPCVTEMPTLAALQEGLGGKDFEVVAISVDKENAATEAKDELAKLSKGALTFYHDPKMAIVYPLKARGFPTSILYDRQGKEIARLAGEADWNSPEARALIKAAMDQST
jgi:thiol-disulfide isomerase/thioredoxin